MSHHSWHAWLLLLRPERIERHLQTLVEAGVIDTAPTLWQIELGVLRMWHRVLFRSDTIGTSTDPTRPGLRARLLAQRPLRFPFLVWERAIAPMDHSGLAQPAWRMKRHLLAAHHDQDQALYDLEILSANPEVLHEVMRDARAIAEDTHPRAAWLKDLCVFEGYHARLADTAERALRGDLASPYQDDPDISFRAWIRWCLQQPAQPIGSLRRVIRRPVSKEHGPESSDTPPPRRA